MTHAKKLSMAFVALLPTLAVAKDPDCASWPINMAQVALKNYGLIDIPSIDFKTIKAVRLASQQIGKDLYQQIYNITFYTKDGKSIEVITNSKASSEECSMSDVDVYVISRKIDGSAEPPSSPSSASGSSK